MSTLPRLSIGLPVYNGERFLAESIEALLGQSYDDFELIISDNASTDDTPGICHRYERRDSRIRYVRQPHNIGLVPNHNFVVGQARGELFKWASHDDLYARDLLKRCVDALDEHPQVVLAQSWSATIDSTGTPTKLIKYPEATASSRAPERLRSMLFDGKGDYTYAVMRTNVLRRTPLHASYHFADRTLITELALHGPFYQVEDWLYFRRDRPEEPGRTVRDRCAIFDPRRADRLRNPAVRLYAEYIWGYLSAIQRVPLSPRDRRECYVCLARWIGSRAVPAREPLGQPISPSRQPVLYLVRWLASVAVPGRDVRVGEEPPADQPDISIDALVPGRGRRPA
jgi:glycosyltransferase involved in cell wall biosynthesis